MKKTALIAGLAGVLLPVSFVFADDGSTPPPPPQGGIGLGAAAHVNFRADASGTLPQIIRARIGIDANASTSVHGPREWRNATGTPSTTPAWERGEKRGIEKRFGTTTPPGHMGAHASSTMHLHGGGNPLKGFFDWLFQLPASTTVGDIRADIAASTTASTSPMHPHSLGNIFAHFFAGFGAFFGAR